MEKPFDIRDRTFEFSISILDLIELFPHSPGANHIAKQIVRAGTSVGANVEEAVGGSSKADFINKNLIALREARETNYWLRIVKRKHLAPDTQTDGLLQESEEIKKILGAIVSTARKTRKT